MTNTQIAESHTLWLMTTLHHAVSAVLEARLGSTRGASQTNIPPALAMKTKQTLFCCGYEVDMATDVDSTGAVPKPKDVTICLNCGAWLKFNEDLKCIRFEAEDLLDLTDEQLNKMRRATEMIRKRGPIKR
jgi:hypothetical protein